MSKLLKAALFLTIIAASLFAVANLGTVTPMIAKVTKVMPPDSSKFRAVSTVKTQGNMSFTSGLANQYYHSDSFNNTGYLYLETKAAKYVNEGHKRLPLNISLVLDHSGSMAGEKMRYVKEAAKFVVDNLTAEDYLSIVVYDDNVTVLQEAVKVTDKPGIKAKIEKVYDEGSTNLSGGMLEGYVQVKANYKKDYVNRVLLLSDGLANQGITDTAQLQNIVKTKNLEHGITISTFGVGLDYNEDLMTGLAEYGSGNYYFIESPDNIPAIFEKELSGLLNVVAQNASITAGLPEGVQLVDVFGYKYELNGNMLTVNFRDVYSEETKGVLIKYRIPGKYTGNLHFKTILKYDDAVNGERVEIESVEIQQATADAQLVEAYNNELVMQQVVLFEANRRMELAMREVDLGRYENARQLMQQNTLYINQMSGIVNFNKEIIVMDSVNNNYYKNIGNVEHQSERDRKILQKRSKGASYDVKKKK